MTGPRPDPFEPLDPPAGGLAALRSRIERESVRPPHPLRSWAWAAATVAAVSLACVLLLWHGTSRPLAIAGGDDLLAIRLGLVDSPSEPVTVAPDQRSRVALQRVPLPTDEVVFYRVGTAAPAGTD